MSHIGRQNVVTLAGNAITRRSFTAIVVGSLASIALVQPVATFAHFQSGSMPTTALDQLAVRLIDGNGYAITEESGAWYVVDGEVVVTTVSPVAIQGFVDFAVQDMYDWRVFLQQTAEYYPSGMFGKLATFADAEAAAYYTTNLLEKAIKPEWAADPTTAQNAVVLDDLPDHPEALFGYQFETFANDGGLLPSFRYLAQVGSLVTSISVVSQNPQTASAASLAMLDAQLAAIAADQAPSPIPFPRSV